ALALSPFGFLLGILHLLLDLTELLDGFFLCLPFLCQSLDFRAEPRDLLFDFLQTLLSRRVLVPSNTFTLNFQLANSAQALVQGARHAIDFHAEARSRLIHQIDSLSGQK